MSEVDKTLWVGNLPEVSEEILYELFLQAGPLESVRIAKERDGRQKSFAFVQFCHVESVPYTIKLMEGTQLYGRSLKLQTRPGSVHHQQQQEQQQQLQQQHQQQQHQQQMAVQEHYRTVMNPYQNNQSQIVQNPYMNMQNMQMTVVPPNPYMVVQPLMNQSTGGTPPSFRRSHTWHGSDLSSTSSSGEKDRDRDNDRRRDNRSRDRSRGGDDRVYDDYRGSPSTYNERRSHNDSFESRRQKILQKQEQVIQSYRRDRDRHGGSSYHHQRRGRY